MIAVIGTVGLMGVISLVWAIKNSTDATKLAKERRQLEEERRKPYRVKRPIVAIDVHINNGNVRRFKGATNYEGQSDFMHITDEDDRTITHIRTSEIFAIEVVREGDDEIFPPVIGFTAFKEDI